MAGKEPEYGPTAEAVAANITRLRTEQNLSYTDVSERMKSAGWSLTPVAVRRIEHRQRKVSPDDLTAIAAALGVSPATLLMPNTQRYNDFVQLTGVRRGGDQPPIVATMMWHWLTALPPHPTEGSPGLESPWGAPVSAFEIRASPEWRRNTLRVIESQGSGKAGFKFESGDDGDD